MIRHYTAFATAALGLAIAFHATATPPPDRTGKNNARSESPAESRQQRRDANVEDILFTVAEQALLARYLEEHGYGPGGKTKPLPPGLQKQVARGKGLPPGWQDKVRRGEVLDSELYSYARPLPDDWLRRLPRGPENTALYQLDDRIVRVDTLTRAVLDIFYLAR